MPSVKAVSTAGAGAADIRLEGANLQLLKAWDKSWAERTKSAGSRAGIARCLAADTGADRGDEIIWGIGVNGGVKARQD